MLTEGIFIHNSQVTKVPSNSVKVHILNKQDQVIGLLKCHILKLCKYFVM